MLVFSMNCPYITDELIMMVCCGVELMVFWEEEDCGELGGGSFFYGVQFFGCWTVIGCLEELQVSLRERMFAKAPKARKHSSHAKPCQHSANGSLNATPRAQGFRGT